MNLRFAIDKALLVAAAALLGGPACGSANDAGLFEDAPGTPTTGGMAGGGSGGGSQGGAAGGSGGSGAAGPTGGQAGAGGQVVTGGRAGAGGLAGGAGGIAAAGSGPGGAGGSGVPDAGPVGGAGGGGGAEAGAPVICQPGAPICTQGLATTCNAEGTGPVPGGTDCSVQNATCADGVCVPSCAVGTFGCSCSQGSCGSGLVCNAQSLCETQPPVAHWRFEDDAVDASSNGFDGVEQNGVGYTDGVDGRAALFNRTDDTYVEIDAFADTFSTIIGSFTVFVRVRLDAYASDEVHTLFGMGSPGETQSTNEFRFIYENGVQIETETGFGQNHLTRLGDIPSEDVWHDLVFVVDGSTVTYYLDGAWVSEETFTPSDTTSSSMVIGGWQDGHALEGAIDDVRVWDALLSAEQIAAL